MMPYDVPFRLLLAVILGSIIGLERETHKTVENEQKVSVGLRTFSLISLLGALAGVLYTHNIGIFIFASAVFGLLIVGYYILQSIMTKDVGITTELGMLTTYIVGVLIGAQLMPVQLIVAIVVVLVMILSRKEDIRNIIGGIDREEIHAFVSYALIALVILPFLPNTPYTVASIPGAVSFFKAYGVDLTRIAHYELINPFRLWFIVALITGIDMAGYALERLIGKKHGRIVASLVGGFISSTSTTISLAQESKAGKGINKLVAAAIFSNMTSFFQIFILLAPLNGALLVHATGTLLLMIVSSFAAGVFFMTRGEELSEKDPSDKKPVSESEIFALGPALRFASIFIIIRFASKIAIDLFGDTGLYITSIIGSFTGIDAILINLSELAGRSITFQTALVTLILVNATNLLSKTFFSYFQGSRAFTVRFFVAVVVIVAASTIGLVIT